MLRLRLTAGPVVVAMAMIHDRRREDVREADRGHGGLDAAARHRAHRVPLQREREVVPESDRARRAIALTEVRVTQRYLEPLCLNGASVKPGEREWTLGAGAHSLTFTMWNAPRRQAEPEPGIDAKTAGMATVSFTLETGHQYEVEVRAPAATFSLRVWERGDWSPVVRDRTADRIVSGDPTWDAASCPPWRSSDGVWMCPPGCRLLRLTIVGGAPPVVGLAEERGWTHVPKHVRAGESR